MPLSAVLSASVRPLPLAIAASLVLAAGCSHPAPHRTKAAADAPAVVAEDQVREHDSNRGRRAPDALKSAQDSIATIAAPAPPFLPAVPATPQTASGAMAVLEREVYAPIEPQPVQQAATSPVSTFSIDVDTGSYANVRRMLAAGRLPAADAVRAEEMINYFDYGYPAPAAGSAPFSITTELAPAPWDDRRHLLLVGIKGFEVGPEDVPAANLVFLVDTSGSMGSADKLGLLKEALTLLAAQMRPQDRVAIVAYAGSAGLVLPSTPGSERGRIIAALERLEAGGSTNGGAGIELAYEVARQNFVDGGVNRVVLATDGDFNVGVASIDALKTLVAARRGSGIALTTLGFGAGNYNDAMAEQLADIGNGNHAYIDTSEEAHKVMVEELSSTMLTIASDVKIQIEFNPAVVAEYRLVGYENRMLRNEDFANDRVDAGEIGAGHDVTALYELALVGSGGERLTPLRYGKRGSEAGTAVASATDPELAHLRLRYKQPGDGTSQLIETPVLHADVRAVASDRLAFAASVGAFADALRGGHNLAGWTFKDIATHAAKARGADPFGYRAGFVDLVERAQELQEPSVSSIAE